MTEFYISIGVFTAIISAGLFLLAVLRLSLTAQERRWKSIIFQSKGQKSFENYNAPHRMKAKVMRDIEIVRHYLNRASIAGTDEARERALNMARVKQKEIGNAGLNVPECEADCIKLIEALDLWQK